MEQEINILAKQEKEVRKAAYMQHLIETNRIPNPKDKTTVTKQFKRF